MPRTKSIKRSENILKGVSINSNYSPTKRLPFFIEWCQTDDVFSKIRTRCAEIDQEPEKSKPLKNQRGRQKSTIDRLEAMEAKAKSYKDSNGFGLGNIKVTQDVVDWVEKKGYKLQSRSVKW